MTRPLLTALAALCSLSLAQAARQAPEATCAVQRHGPAPTVVELYTSEGCSSCAPAERWSMNSLKGRSEVLGC